MDAASVAVHEHALSILDQPGCVLDTDDGGETILARHNGRVR
jgi:hypothetical protein